MCEKSSEQFRSDHFLVYGHLGWALILKYMNILKTLTWHCLSDYKHLYQCISVCHTFMNLLKILLRCYCWSVQLDKDYILIWSSFTDYIITNAFICISTHKFYCYIFITLIKSFWKRCQLILDLKPLDNWAKESILWADSSRV